EQLSTELSKQPKSTILVKGSRSSKMELVVEAIVERYKASNGGHEAQQAEVHSC
ncbi:MAG: hypothetical protein ACI8WB_000279, partial [Phenylobacterium sp.]